MIQFKAKINQRFSLNSWSTLTFATNRCDEISSNEIEIENNKRDQFNFINFFLKNEIFCPKKCDRLEMWSGI